MVEKLTKKLCDDVFYYYRKARNCKKNKDGKFAFLSEQIFNLVTYDRDLDVSWGRSIYEVLTAIRNGENAKFQTIGYIHYSTFMTVCQVLRTRGWIDWNLDIKECFFYESQLSKDFSLFFIGMPVTEKGYDHEGVKYSVNNLNVLLDWIGE